MDAQEMNRKVSVEDMMRAREQRAWAQRQMLAAHGLPLVSLTMNIPGPVKVTPAIARAFELAVARVTAQLVRAGRVVDRAQTRAFTGLETLFAVQTGDLYQLKRLMCEIEDEDAFGRLLDADVLDAQGEKLSRADVGLPVRRCLLCAREAPVCARSRTHSAEELFARTMQIIDEALTEQFVERVGQSAQRALLYEAAVTPKPGLVDRANNGAHTDMDFFTFLDSASVLGGYFAACAREGAAHHADVPRDVLPALQRHGVRAEQTMLRATHGVNTHKGAVFSLGVVCGALGMLYGRRGGAWSGAQPEEVLDLCAEMTADAMRAALAGLTEQRAQTFGERLYVRHGIAGARGEAAAGFPSVRRAGLPAYRAARAAGASVNDAGVAALLALMACAEDSNVIRRGGLARAQTLMREAAQTTVADAATLDAQLIREHVSPGGCADLLAVTFLLVFLFDADARKA